MMHQLSYIYISANKLCSMFSPVHLMACCMYSNYAHDFHVEPRDLFNPKETSWGLKGPVAYISYHCISLKNRFLLKRYVFPKDIVLHNIMCETNWIVITTKFYR